MATTEHSNVIAGATSAVDEQQEREVARKLAERYRYAFIDLREQRIDPELFRTIPADLMFRYNFVPLESHNNMLCIAAADPGQVQMSDELPLLLGKKRAIKVATPRQIADLLKRTEQSQRVLEQATEAFTLQVAKEEEESEETISGDRLTRDTTVSPVVRLVETIIFTAPERRVPQDGRFRVKYKGRFIDLRVSIMPATHGEDAVLRVLDKETLSEKFQSLNLEVVGFSPEETRRFRRYIREPYGMVLVTGPTGSGKTTTLYAAVNEIKSDEDKIVTIEDPVEYMLRGITQIPVNEKKGLTFARGLRSILRHDPDKIMVGEIRDQETAQIAIQSALTGHLVFTTVHANNVTDVIGRFINMGVEPYNFVSALNCIMAQRLVRVICPNCKKQRKYSPEELKEAGLDPAVWADVVFSEGTGCLECSGTGYHGRTAICELLDLTDRIREMIIDRRPTSEIKRVAREEGMITLRESGLAKTRAGITTIKEINKVTFVE